jgi:hypothetical protein
MHASVRRVGFALITGALLVFGVTGIATAHSGDVVASENCSTWSVTVTLAHNVTMDRTVDVETTIPGTSGFVGEHFDSSFGQIWSASGPAPASGTVTLEIFNGSKLEFHTSATIVPSVDCSSPTPVQSFQGQTGFPSIDPSVAPSDTPFESFQGETATPARSATPPPTSTGSDSSGNGSTPLFALLISLAFGSLGLMAVQAQRRNVRRRR